jgi:hypothetical protein
MNEEQRGLALDLIDIVDNHLGKHYVEVSERLNGSLYGPGLETSPAAAIANKMMLSQVVELLPQVEANEQKVMARTPAEARWLANSLVWYRPNWGYGYAPPTPRYLLGAQVVGKRASLLLHTVKQAEPAVAETRRTHVQPPTMYRCDKIRTSEFRYAERLMRDNQNLPLSEDELSNLYQGGTYWVHPRSIASLWLIEQGFVEKRRIQYGYHGAAIRERAARPFEVNAISNETLAGYGVLDRVAHIAAGIGKTAEIKRIIENNKPS